MSIEEIEKGYTLSFGDGTSDSDDVVKSFSNGKFFEAKDVTKSSDIKQTTQLSTDDIVRGIDEIPVPPIDYEYLSRIYDLNSTNKFCINLKANLTVGLGYKLTKPASKKVTEFLENPNTNAFETFQDILEKSMIDNETFGRFAWEYNKTLTGKKAIYHVNSKTVYPIPDKDMKAVLEYIQAFPILSVYGGSKTKIARIKPYSKEYSSKVTPFKKTMLIVRDAYNPNSSWYGMPEYLTAIPQMGLIRDIAEYFTNFFKNSTTPSWIMHLTGTQLSLADSDIIKNRIDALRGPENAGKGVLLSFANPETKIGFEKMQNPIEPSYLELKNSSIHEIAQIHGVPPKILGISSAGSLGSGSESVGALLTLIKTKINPLQEMVERMVNVLIKNEFGEDVGFKLNKLELVTEKDMAVLNALLVKSGIKTINEARESSNLELFGEEYDSLVPTSSEKIKVHEQDSMTNVDPDRESDVQSQKTTA